MFQVTRCFRTGAMSPGNVAFGLRMRGESQRADNGARVAEMLDLVGLEPGSTSAGALYELSGGERQRVALARAWRPARAC